MLTERAGKVIMVDPLQRGDSLDLMTEIVLRKDEMATAYAAEFGGARPMASTRATLHRNAASLKRLLLVCHGETRWNAVRCLRGKLTFACRSGAAQARALAPMVAALTPIMP